MHIGHWCTMHKCTQDTGVLCSLSVRICAQENERSMTVYKKNYKIGHVHFSDTFLNFLFSKCNQDTLKHKINTLKYITLVKIGVWPVLPRTQSNFLNFLESHEYLCKFFYVLNYIKPIAHNSSRRLTKIPAAQMIFPAHD